MDFFAISGAPVQKVYRLDIEQQLQSQLEQQFKDHAAFLDSDNLEIIPFEGGNFTPDESEVLEINPFDLPAIIYDPLQNIAGCDIIRASDIDALSSVYCVFGYDAASDKLIFQVIQKQQRLTNRTNWAIFLSRDTFKRLEDPGLILGGACHAVYENSSLKFKSMWWAKQIFDISDFYREATDADVENFANIPNIIVDDVEVLKKKTGQWARTRIAFIVDSGILTKFTPQQLATQARQFEVPLVVEVDPNNPGVERLRIPQELKALRSVLKFLEEEFYIGVITGLPYEANSKRKR